MTVASLEVPNPFFIDGSRSTTCRSRQVSKNLGMGARGISFSVREDYREQFQKSQDRVGGGGKSPACPGFPSTWRRIL